jgi:hypothetical protein
MESRRRAPNGSGYVSQDGYRYISVGGRQRPEQNYVCGYVV